MIKIEKDENARNSHPNRELTNQHEIAPKAIQIATSRLPAKSSDLVESIFSSLAVNQFCPFQRDKFAVNYRLFVSAFALILAIKVLHDILPQHSASGTP